MEIFVQILVVLVLARLFGEAAERLGQSASVGELLLQESAVLAHLGTLGIFFLVLMAGIEMQPKEIAETSKAAFLVSPSAACWCRWRRAVGSAG
jgi:Kef-type K+ transport system membrane component KefB